MGDRSFVRRLITADPWKWELDADPGSGTGTGAERSGCHGRAQLRADRNLPIDPNAKRSGSALAAGAPQGLLLHTPQVGGEILLEALLDQPERHARLALHRQLVKQPGTDGIRSHPPGSFEAAEIALKHPEQQATLLRLLGDLELHTG